MNTLEFPIGTYRFFFETARPVPESWQALKYWRGHLGDQLKAQVCHLGDSDCIGKNCPKVLDCGFAQVFRTGMQNVSNGQFSGPQAPHPFALRPLEDSPQNIDGRHFCGFELSLFGTANRWLTDVFIAMLLIGERGVGPLHRTIPAELVAVLCLDHLTGQWHAVNPRTGGGLIPPATPVCGNAPAAVRMVIYRPMQTSTMHTDDLTHMARGILISLMNRVKYLHPVYHPTGETIQILAAAWPQAIKEIEVAAGDLKLQQDRRHATSLNGSTGWLDIAGPGLSILWPLVVIGTFIHAGSHATYGNGAYRLAPTER